MDNLPLNKTLAGCLIVLAALILIVWWPIAVIWSVNTLFRADIPYNFSTWVATMVLVTILRVSTLYSEKR